MKIQNALENSRPKGARLWVMRLLAVLLIPTLALGIAEFALRSAGVGHPTKFFLPQEVAGEDYLFVNQAYTRRFFPPSIARSPIPQRFLKNKPEGTFRIFIFGESAANGDPDPAYGVGRHLEILLEERYPDTDFEVICTAITAINSHAILPIARECAKLQGDAWILYMGNNEMVGSFGAGTIFGAKAPPLATARATLAIKSTRIGQLIEGLVQRTGGNKQGPDSWGGIAMFTDNLLRHDDPGRLQVYENFRKNLQDIMKAGQQAGIPVFLSTVGSNLFDCAPFASLHSENLSEESLSQWDSLFQEGKSLEASGSFQQALELYKSAAEIDATFADLQYRIGRCLAMIGNWEESRTALELARDNDALVVRADTRINKIITESASKDTTGKVTLIDTDGVIGRESPGGIPGQSLFYEHVHYTLQGNYTLAMIFAENLSKTLPSAVTKNSQPTWAEPFKVQIKLAISFWDKHRLWTEMRERFSVAPFNARSSNANNLAYCASMATSVAGRINPRIDRKMYAFALSNKTDDYLLRSHYGSYLVQNGFIGEAIEELQWVCDTYPEFEGGHQELGIALLLSERFSEAETSFQRVLEINPHYSKARAALKLIREQQP